MVNNIHQIGPQNRNNKNTRRRRPVHIFQHRNSSDQSSDSSSAANSRPPTVSPPSYYAPPDHNTTRVTTQQPNFYQQYHRVGTPEWCEWPGSNTASPQIQMYPHPPPTQAMYPQVMTFRQQPPVYQLQAQYVNPGMLMYHTPYGGVPVFAMATSHMYMPQQHHQHQVYVPPQTPQQSLPKPPARPRNLSCFNCGASGHTGYDCKEPTLEELLHMDSYRLNYNHPDDRHTKK